MEKETFIFNKKKIIEQLNNQNIESLIKEADNVRSISCGQKVHIRGIIAFSNYCCRNCLYCGLRKGNKKVVRYRMSPDEIIKLSNEIIQIGIKTIVLQSGDDFGYSQKMVSNTIYRIKKENSDIAITLSLGERPFTDYKAFKDAGADRYLLKYETANPKLYEYFHPGQTLKKRINILEYLKKLGYQVGTGNIIGLPGQTLKDLACDILLIKELDIDMAGIGPFIPQKDTPLKNFPSGSLELTLKVLAITRILTKNIHLPATTALGSLNPQEGQLLGFKVGCNVIMPDFTPEYYRRNYVIYDNKIRVNLEKAKELIVEAQRSIAQDRGDSLK